MLQLQEFFYMTSTRLVRHYNLKSVQITTIIIIYQSSYKQLWQADVPHDSDFTSYR